MNYHEEQNKEMIHQLREILNELPSFCFDYFQAAELSTAVRTRLGYARDLRIFFKYLLEYVELIASKYTDILDIELQDLDLIKATDIEAFLNHITLYSSDRTSQDVQNGEKGKARKLAAIRSFYKYYYKKELIKTDPAMLVSTPKIHDKTIVRLDAGEISRLLDEIESGEKLTKHQKDYHDSTKLRDIALITTLLGTGMRISECVGLDIRDIDFDNNALKIIRKGGNEAIIYFGSEVAEALQNYLSVRKEIVTEPGHENALFLSLQKKRLGVRSIQKLVDKYAKAILPLKHLSPHKFRSSYGTALYNETGDIYLVASVLGHKDVNTTRKHYAVLDEDRRRNAANIVKLRSEKQDR